MKLTYKHLTQMKASIKKVILSVLVADDEEDETDKLIIICVFFNRLLRIKEKQQLLHTSHTYEYVFKLNSKISKLNEI